jgi:hypothetical protein
MTLSISRMEAVVRKDKTHFRTTQEGLGTIQFSLELTLLGLHMAMPDNVNPQSVEDDMPVVRETAGLYCPLHACLNS